MPGMTSLSRKLARRLRDEAMLVGEALGRQAPTPASPGSSSQAAALVRECRRHATRSRMPAAPMPPPTHIVTRPYRAWRRCIS